MSDDAKQLEDWELQAATLKKQGDTSFSTGDYSSAIKHYTSAISIDDSNAVLYSNRAACLLKVNERSRALRDGERCVELKPDWGKGYGRKAAAQFSLRRYEAAADTYREGLAKDPDNKALKEGLNDAKRKAREAEEEEQRRKEEEQRKEEENAKKEEDLLGDFFGEIETAVEESSSKAAKKDTLPQKKYTDQDLGTSSSQMSRLLQPNYKWKNLNPYNVLLLGPDANEEDVKSRYRRLSALVHPDKNIGADNAKDAFDEVKKAYNLLKEADAREYNASLVESGRARGEEVHRAAVKAGTAKPDDLEAYKAKEVMRVFAAIEADRRRIENNKLQGKKRERQQEDEEQDRLKKEHQFNKDWNKEDRVEGRIENWRDMQKKKKKKTT